mmetsp:Transcript_12258/g.17864  ORF Transcript_12258/g.17864 Transcript_12258/m.17864 type:complete len:94 (-) Transcript_12258:109-390(-)
MFQTSLFSMRSIKERMEERKVLMHILKRRILKHGKDLSRKILLLLLQLSTFSRLYLSLNPHYPRVKIYDSKTLDGAASVQQWTEFGRRSCDIV